MDTRPSADNRTAKTPGPLATYLNDHLAGSTAALQLLDHLVETAGTPAERQFFTTIRAEVADDRATLEDLTRRIGDGPSTLRHIGGWLAEKASRLKLMLDDPSGHTLKELEALEMLTLGIHGKRGLWRALGEVSTVVPALAVVDLLRLEERADDQHARVEARRLDAARRVLRPTASG